MSAPTNLDRAYQSLLTTTRDKTRGGMSDEVSSLADSITKQKKKKGRTRKRRKLLKNYMNTQSLPLDAK